jgi:hypothetical protein
MNVRSGLWTIGFFACLSTLSVSCGGGSKSTPLTIDDFCTQKAAAECQVAGLCAVPMADCESARKMVCMNFVAMANVAPRVFVPGNVPACVNKAKAVYAETIIKPTDLDALDDVCNYVFQGATADLAACVTKYECKNAQQICDKGHCATQMNVAAGAQCPAFGAVCPTNQYCKTMGAAMICSNKGSTGDTCDPSTPCDATKMLTCTGGKCAMQVSTGQACTGDVDCLAAAPYCNPYAGNKCSTGLTFSAGANSCNAYGGTGSTTGAGGSGGAGAGGAGSGGAGSGGAGGSAGADAGGGTDAADAAGDM